MRIRFVLMAAACWLCAPLGWGGHAIPAVFKDFSSKPPSQYTAVIRINGGLINIHTAGFSGESTDLRYAAGENIIRHVNHTSHEYVELNAETLGRASEWMKGALDTLQETWSGTPSAPAAPSITRQEGLWPLNGMSCSKYRITFEKDAFQDVWLADWKQAGLSRSEFQAVMKMALAYERMASTLGALPFLSRIPVKELNRLDGYPVLIKQVEQGKLRYEILLERPSARAWPPELFQVPKGYKRTWF